MALTVEDGTGLPDADSFNTLEEITAYLEGRGAAEDWSGLSTDEQEQVARKAADYLRNEQRFPWRGTQNSYDQGLPFPRTDLSMYRGPEIPSDVVPRLVKHAQAALCGRVAAGIELQPDLERGGQIQTETIDVLTTTYFESAPAETLFPDVMGFLYPLLRAKDMPITDASPILEVPVDESPFETGEFDNT